MGGISHSQFNIVIQIVVPTKPGGVYDFASRLVNAIGKDSAQLVPLSENNVTEWVIGKNDYIFLQLSGYGFAKRGVPFWLLHEIERRRKDIKALGIFFHEIYAFGPPWRSSFWLSPLQRYITRRLAETSDFWMTNREGSAQWLRQHVGNKPHAVLPVFSNIGESYTASSVRVPKIAVFGSAGLRGATYKMANNDLFVWSKEQSLEIHDIGKPIQDEKIKETLVANNVFQHGSLKSEIVCRLLEETQFGVIAYPSDYVAKSSVFAAYCTHGVCPILISKNHAQVDGLYADTHYIPGIPVELVPADKALAIGHSARDWYQPHDLASHALSIINLIENCH